MQRPDRTSTRTSALRRYAPILSIAAVIAVLAGVFAILGDGEDEGGAGGAPTSPSTRASELPVIYSESQATGTLDRYDWGAHCDPETGRIAMPSLGAAPCVPEFRGDNGGATSQGVTADTIRIAYYVAAPDPQGEALLRLAGAFDERAQIEQTMREYADIYQGMYELYGRKIQLVPLVGTGTGSDEAAARADAIRAAKELDVFGVIGGPTQSKAFAEELADNKVLCLGSCLLAQPEKFYIEHSPYLWSTSPSPDQTAMFTTELIKKQLLGKKAEFAGDPALRDKERVFGLLSYDTPDGNFTVSWDNFERMLSDAGVDLATHVTYFLDLTKAQEDSRTLITKLKNTGVTTVIFTGDPIMPKYFTEEATAQDYHPEWVMAGTVFADTDVFGRTFDQEQWSHAFGISLIPTPIDKENDASSRLYEWWFGPGHTPAAENTYAIIAGTMNLLFNAVQLAGPDLTPESFRDGAYRIPVLEQGPLGLRLVVSYGKNGVWPGAGHVDVMGLDNVTIIWWDPTAPGVDETGAEGAGMYRHFDGGRRYLPGEMPTEPIELFDNTADAVTSYHDTPAELRPPDYPPPEHG